LCTGINSLRLPAVLAAAAWLLLPTGVSEAQSLKLSSLRLPPDVAAGSWVAYQVNVTSQNRPPRRFTQRLAVVSREGTGAEAGAWVELKTIESGKARIERGFFMPPDAGRDAVDSSFVDDAPATDERPVSDAPSVAAPTAGASHSSPPAKLKLARYQRLTPEGKLYEYAVDEEGAPLADEDVSAMDMFEFSGRGSADTLAPDTLRAGRKVIPCRVRCVRRSGTQDWQGDDTTYVNRAVMSRTYWRNPWIPVTGYARLVVEVSTERIPVRAASPPDSAARGPAGASAASADTAGAGTVAPAGREPGAANQTSFYRAEATLIDLGRDAVPEITQVPEPAPQESTPRPRNIIK
jgi:hypothetical protein